MKQHCRLTHYEYLHRRVKNHQDYYIFPCILLLIQAVSDRKHAQIIPPT